MRTLLKKIIDGLREDLGQPVSLPNLLAEHPKIRVSLESPTPCIALDSIVCWYKLGESSLLTWPRRERGYLMGWTSSGGHYASFGLCRPEFEHIVYCKIIEDWPYDIADVNGFSSSQSNLSRFVSTDQMVETNSHEMIDEVTHEKLASNLSHREIRIIHGKDTGDHFVRHLWDGRIFLSNSGESHHFAAAKYIAARLPDPVTLRGRLCIYSLNLQAIASLRSDFEMFIISDEADVSLGFHDAMRAFNATWLWHHLPAPYAATARAILLPKNERRSMRVAALLRQAGIVDFGEYLSDLAVQQLQR